MQGIWGGVDDMPWVALTNCYVYIICITMVVIYFQANLTTAYIHVYIYISGD